MSTETSTPSAQDHAISQGSTFVWHEVYTPDAATAIKFYTEALDFGTTEMDMGPGGTYKMLTRDGKGVCGIWDTSKNDQMKDVPPHWATYLSVDDVDKRVQKAQEHGGTLVVPAMDVPTVGRMALIADPTGAHIWLFTPKM